MERIYLDHAATTPIFPEVREAIEPWLSGEFGNPSSLHEPGRRAKDALDEARETIAQSIGSEFGEITFTSSGTEAANAAILGVALNTLESNRNRVLISSSDHHCVLNTEKLLAKLGFRVEQIPTLANSIVDIEWLSENVDDSTLLVSVMHANNETGAYQPVKQIAAICHKRGALYFCDAVQTFLDWKIGDLDADLISIAGHKINAPKGVGALYVRAGIKLQSLSLGGGQEREMRAGTENVAGIVGFGAAVRTHHRFPERRKSRQAARDAFESKLKSGMATLPESTRRLSGNAHFRFPSVNAETLLIRLDRAGVSASSGAACSSGSLEPSHVLLAMGFSEREAGEAVRFTFGWPNTIQ
jgi:cysteine desulfurase